MVKMVKYLNLLYLRCPLSDLDETWRVYAGGNYGMSVCLFVCSPTPPRFLDRSLPNLVGCSPTPPRFCGRSLPNLEGWWRGTPELSLRGSFFERSRLKVKKGQISITPKS